MHAWLSLLLALAAAGAQAAPPTSAEDDVGRFMAEKGLLERPHEPLPPMGAAPHDSTHRASELVLTAMGYLGVPYKFGGSSFEGGLDCSGFVQAIYGQTAGLALPRRAEEQAAAARPIPAGELQPGDLVFFNTLRRAFSHVGIYIGDHKFIHSPRPGAHIRVEDMRVSYWARRFDGARRVLPAAAGWDK